MPPWVYERNFPDIDEFHGPPRSSVREGGTRPGRRTTR
jgi:hypothetical protein